MKHFLYIVLSFIVSCHVAAQVNYTGGTITPITAAEVPATPNPPSLPALTTQGQLAQVADSIVAINARAATDSEVAAAIAAIPADPNEIQALSIAGSVISLGIQAEQENGRCLQGSGHGLD